MARPDPTELFDRPLVPIASESDARVTRETVLPYLAAAGSTVILVHVIKQSEGGVDPSPLDLQEEEAERLFDIATEGHGGVNTEIEYAYGANVAESILETARETAASVIILSPRKRSLFMRVLTGETARPLLTNPDVPVLSVPHDREGN